MAFKEYTIKLLRQTLLEKIVTSQKVMQFLRNHFFWIPGQARNDRLHKPYVVMYKILRAPYLARW